MKVFVYTKEPKPRKIATITDVATVTEFRELRSILIETVGGMTMTYDTHKVKTTIYQN